MVKEAWQSMEARWTALPRLEKAIRAALVIAGLTATGWAALTGFLALPGRVDAVEARVGRLEASQDRTSRGVEFLVCRDQRREHNLPLDYCDHFWADADFLPPARTP